MFRSYSRNIIYDSQNRQGNERGLEGWHQLISDQDFYYQENHDVGVKGVVQPVGNVLIAHFRQNPFSVDRINAPKHGGNENGTRKYEAGKQKSFPLIQFVFEVRMLRTNVQDVGEHCYSEIYGLDRLKKQ